ncbi:hypothetical protein NDU88_002794 [Pleurodeles waltl]|uniref:Uncharacterized protein n=1 Tax=Pleurodeles waltl TaxID=8319 RepID=A0AAV7WQX7_PLEWA|nr:hypothetical protein NDU88_002794 [Pleurodeles waltl]
MLKRTAIKCHERRGEGSNLEPNEKKKRKKKARGARAMSWDCTGIQQLPHSLDDLLVAPAGLEIDATKSETPPPSLGLIYQTIMAQHKQTQGVSKTARVATKQLQVAVSKIAKTCSEIGERIATIESWADVLETDLGAVVQQTAIHDTQLYDIQWKIEDFENRQCHNNLRVVGAPEGRVPCPSYRLCLAVSIGRVWGRRGDDVGFGLGDKIAAMKAGITQMYLDQDIVKAQTRSQECYKFSEKVGKLFAYNTRQRGTRDVITAIKDSQVHTVRGDLAILEVF